MRIALHMCIHTVVMYNIVDVDKIRINGMTTSKSFILDQPIELNGKNVAGASIEATVAKLRRSTETQHA